MERIRKKIQKIPERKRYIDFIAALFAIPVMATVLLINIGNLQNEKKDDPEASQPTQESVVIQPSNNNEAQDTEGSQQEDILQNNESCIKKVGPISIKYPAEGQTLYSNPVNILIDYDATEYCSVVWSYKINNTEWSEYTSNSISLFNPPQGNIQLELRVQSTASNDQTQLERNFEYKGPSQDTIIEEASSSAITQ